MNFNTNWWDTLPLKFVMFGKPIYYPKSIGETKKHSTLYAITSNMLNNKGLSVAQSCLKDFLFPSLLFTNLNLQNLLRPINSLIMHLGYSLSGLKKNMICLGFQSRSYKIEKKRLHFGVQFSIYKIVRAL